MNLVSLCERNANCLLECNVILVNVELCND